VLKISFEDWNLGRGAALGLVITVINFLMSAFYVRALRRPARASSDETAPQYALVGLTLAACVFAAGHRGC
jgi:hypothetical protein